MEPRTSPEVEEKPGPTEAQESIRAVVPSSPVLLWHLTPAGLLPESILGRKAPWACGAGTVLTEDPERGPPPVLPEVPTLAQPLQP